MSFFSKTRIKATELFFDAFEYLQRQYEQAGEVFTPASPFGQILTTKYLQRIKDDVPFLNMERVLNGIY